MEEIYLDKTPEEIANVLFTNDPPKKGSTYFSCYESESDSDLDVSTLFEIILTVVMEGLNIYYYGLDNVDYEDINPENILVVNRWMENIGVKVNCSEIKNSKEDEYCKIILKNNCSKSQIDYFKMENGKSYHFLLNQKYFKNGVYEGNFKSVSDMWCSCKLTNGLKNKSMKLKFDLIY